MAQEANEHEAEDDVVEVGPRSVRFDLVSPALVTIISKRVLRQLCLALLGLLGAPTLDETHFWHVLEPVPAPGAGVSGPEPESARAGAYPVQGSSGEAGGKPSGIRGTGRGTAGLLERLDEAWDRGDPGRGPFLAAALKELAASKPFAGHPAALQGAVAVLHRGAKMPCPADGARGLSSAGIGGAAPPVRSLRRGHGVAAGGGSPAGAGPSPPVADQLSGAGVEQVAKFLAARGSDPVPFAVYGSMERLCGREKQARKAFKATAVALGQVWARHAA